MDSLVKWKRRRDLFQESDNVSGAGDQVGDFSEHGDVGLVGSSKDVQFIRKDETNAEALRKFKAAGAKSKGRKIKWW